MGYKDGQRTAIVGDVVKINEEARPSELRCVAFLPVHGIMHEQEIHGASVTSIKRQATLWARFVLLTHQVPVNEGAWAPDGANRWSKAMRRNTNLYRLALYVFSGPEQEILAGLGM